MNVASFKMLLGILQLIAGIVGPYAAGMPFSSTSLFFNLISAFAGGHAITSAVSGK